MNNINTAAHIEDRKIHLYDYMEVLLRRMWIVIIFFVVLVTTVAIGTYRMTPIYSSNATIVIEEKDPWERSDILSEFAGVKPTKVQTEIEVIKSRTIAEKVVKKLQYDVKLFDISRGLNPQLTDLNVPEKLTDKTFAVIFQDKENFIVESNGSKTGIGKALFDSLSKLIFRSKEESIDTHESGITGHGTIGYPFTTSAGLAFTIKKANADKGASFKIKKVSFSNSVNQLVNNTSVSPVKNTNVVKIGTQDDSKQMAADMTNMIIEFYREHDIKARSQQASQVTQFIEKQLDPVHKKVDESLSALARYKSRTDVTDIREGTRVLINNVADLEKARTERVVKRYQVNSLYMEIQRSTSSVSPSALGILGDSLVQGMISQLSTLEGRRKSLLADYTEKHPQVVALTAEINELNEKTNLSIMNILNSLDSQINNLSSEIEGFKNQLNKLPDKEKELADLLRNVEVNNRLHKFLLEKLSEANIMYASTLSQMQIIDKAIPSSRPVKPNTRLNILLGMIVGLVGGVGLAFFIDYLDNSIKSPHDIEKRLGLPIFGRIPYITANKTALLQPKESVDSSSAGLIVSESTKSVAAESLRSLRTNLQFAVMEKKDKIFHITSPEAAEGKTTITANLAITLALMGSKTLLIDLDLRKPKIHQTFGINKEPGITSIITQKATFSEVIRTSDIAHLQLIPAGIVPPNPSELLNQHILSEFLDEIRGQFDYILLDSPPILPVTDAQLLGRLADATFIVFEIGESKLPTAEYGIRQLRNVNVNVAGAIINRVKSFTGYGYYSSYYYHQEYYYGEDTKREKPHSKLKFWKKTETKS